MKKEAIIPVVITMTFIIFAISFFLIMNITDPISVLTSGNSSYTGEALPAEGKKININTATRGELMTLPGIGETLAQRIIDYREEHGAFKSIDGICMIEGIGQKLLDQIEEYITVGGAA